MEKIELVAAKRTAQGKKNQALRAEGKVPAVVYGHGLEALSIELEAKELDKAYRQAGGNQIIGLKVGDDKRTNVLFHDVQHGSIRGEVIHADFYVVRMDELLKAEVPVHFVGESTAVYQLEGTLVKNLETLEVECLPGDLPESIEADISVLDDFEKTITLADLKIPAGVKLMEEDLDMIVVKVEAPRSDAEIAELESELGDTVPESMKEEAESVVTEENDGNKDRRDKK